jgi:hypothetical protein
LACWLLPLLLLLLLLSLLGDCYCCYQLRSCCR